MESKHTQRRQGRGLQNWAGWEGESPVPISGFRSDFLEKVRKRAAGLPGWGWREAEEAAGDSRALDPPGAAWRVREGSEMQCVNNS